MFTRLSSPSYILMIFIVLFSLVIHEFSHALVADLQGDKTARYNGRLTLNPLAHLELFGLIMILFAPIGWARPVPINPNNFRHRRLGMILAVAAGPISNLLIAVISFILLRIGPMTHIWGTIFSDFALLNIALFLFNLIPIPPLDGSQILRNLLPYRQAVSYSRLDVYGPYILLLFFIIPPLNRLFFGPIIISVYNFMLSWFF